MVRQYVGARYVPKFYENSLNPLSNEWEENVSYEALTVVTYLSDSYTAKKPVPVTVGNPRDNAEYWALTGAYNAQVEEYRQEAVAAAEKADAVDFKVGDLSDLETEVKTDIVSAINSIENFEGIYNDDEVLFFGDSLALVNENIGWAKQVSNKMGFLNPKIYANGSSGFVHAGNGGLTMFDLLSNAINGMTDDEKRKVKLVVTLSGCNDIFNNKDGTALINAIVTYISTAKSAFPNAKMILAPLNTARRLTYAQYGLANIIYVTALDNGVKSTFSFVNAFMSFSNYLLDQIHFSSTGYGFMARYLLNYIFYGNDIVERDNVTFTAKSNVVINYLTVNVKNDMVYIKGDVTYNGAITPSTVIELLAIPAYLMPARNIAVSGCVSKSGLLYPAIQTISITRDALCITPDSNTPSGFDLWFNMSYSLGDA